MFNHWHYVPVLKWKRGERVALRNLINDVRKNITPLVELLPNHFEDCKPDSPSILRSILEGKATEFQKCCGSLPFFLDFGHVDNQYLIDAGLHALDLLSNLVDAQELDLIPVIGFGSSRELLSAVKDIVKRTERQVCVRISNIDVENVSFNKNIDHLLDSIGSPREQCNLIVDYGFIDPRGSNLLFLQGRIGNLSDFASYTVLGGSFPPNLIEFEKNMQHTHGRTEWLSWKRQVTSSDVQFVRLPSFGDFTIIHPLLTELPKSFNISASIRYTAEDYWVIMRGEGLMNENSPGNLQYPANARLLCARSEFCGEEFSVGDAYIQSISQKIGQSVGNPEKLIQVGINHHITFAVHQLASLSVSGIAQ